MSLPVRRVRELLVVATTLALAAGAHLLAGGALPTTALPVVALVATVLPAAVWLARRPLTLPRLLPVLVALQVALHVELSVLAAPAGSAAPELGTGGPHAGHAAHSATLGALASAGPATAGPTTAGTSVGTTAAGTTAAHHHLDLLALSSAPMLLAHLAAVVATALVLAAGDRAARTVVAWMSAVVVLVLDARVPVPERARVAVVDRLRPWRALLRLAPGGLRFRGPPAALAVAA